MAKVDGLDGLCNIQDRHILCLTQALDFYAKNNLADLALSKNWSKSDMLQAVAQPLHNISNEYKRSFAFSIPTQKAKTKNGKDASPAIATYTVTMGLSLDEKSNFSLTKTGQCILNHDLSIPSYALTLLSKVGVYNTNNERVTNLLAQFCKYAKDNPNASYTKDDIKSKVLAGIGPNTYFDSRDDIAFNAFLVSGFLSVSNDEKYIVHNDDYDLISFLAANGDNITPPNDEEESYMGDINKGIVELITEDNQYLFYPKYNDLINIKFGKYNTSLNKHNNFSKGPLQQIYYGAPGTGKSFFVDEVCKKHEHFRTTFHPDSDYSTFVGCYKPKSKIVPYSSVATLKNELELTNLWNTSTLSFHEFVGLYYKSVIVMSTSQLKDIFINNAIGDRKTTDSVVEKETKKAVKAAQVYANSLVSENKITYEFSPQAFTHAYVKAWELHENNTPVYLVVEEINRGNCAQIFGDLFQLLDRNDEGYSTYEITPDTDLRDYISKQGLNISSVKNSNDNDISDKIASGELMKLPNNLHILATMNTSDQSLFPIDSAFKRRWDWKYVPIERAEKEPEKNWIIKVTHGGKTYWCYWWEFLEAINHQIEETNHSEDKQLGYFFAKPKNGEDVISTDTFVNKVIFYLWNDVFKDEDSAVFQYGNDKVEDVSINRSGTMYFRHFMENKDEMIHYFINLLFAMGKDKTPVVPIDYLKNDADSKVIEHLPKMREDCEETPMPKKDKGEENAENDKVAGEVDGKSVDTCNFSNDTYKAIAEHIDRNIWMNDKTRGYFQNGVVVKFTDMPISYAQFPITFDSSKNQAEIKLYIPSPSAYNKSGELYTYLKGLGVENIVQTLSTKFQFEWHELGDQNPQSNKVKGWALTLGVDYNNDAVLIANQIISLASEIFYNVDPLISSFINTQR